MCLVPHTAGVVSLLVLNSYFVPVSIKRNDSRINESCLTYEWVMPHIWIGHVSQMNGSCLTYERIMSRIEISDVSHMNESCLANNVGRVICGAEFVCRAFLCEESCPTYECVMSHIWMSHVLHVNGSCPHLNMSDIWMVRDSNLNWAISHT